MPSIRARASRVCRGKADVSVSLETQDVVRGAPYPFSQVFFDLLVFYRSNESVHFESHRSSLYETKLVSN